MMEITKDSRPDCYKILNESNLWALSSSQFFAIKKISQLENYLTDESEYERSFHNLFTQTKRKFYNKYLPQGN
jgi:hypothetical protein